jgi:hypothetical protein
MHALSNIKSWQSDFIRNLHRRRVLPRLREPFYEKRYRWRRLWLM